MKFFITFTLICFAQTLLFKGPFMKNIIIFLIFTIAGIQNSSAKEFFCPAKFDVSFQNTKYSDFEIFPKKMNYIFSSAILYSGHPKEMAALKGSPETRNLKDRPFWLVCNYNFNKSLDLGYKFTKKIPAEYIRCKYLNGFKGIDCEKNTYN